MVNEKTNQMELDTGMDLTAQVLTELPGTAGKIAEKTGIAREHVRAIIQRERVKGTVEKVPHSMRVWKIKNGPELPLCSGKPRAKKPPVPKPNPTPTPTPHRSRPLMESINRLAARVDRLERVVGIGLDQRRWPDND